MTFHKTREATSSPTKRKKENKMKKIISLILAMSMLLGAMLVMTSCGGPSGKYTALGVVDLDFSGKNVTISICDEELGTGTYEIKTGEDGKQKMTITFEGEASYAAFRVGVPVSYEKTENGFKYAGIPFVKADK